MAGISRLSQRDINAFVKGEHKVGRKLADGGGLHLTFTAAGTPSWRIKFRHSGRESYYSVGVYPSVALQAARAARDQVKQWLGEGRDPVQQRKLERAEALASSANTFGEVAALWLKQQARDWSEIHYTKSKQALERDVLPGLGHLPIAEITPVLVSAVVERIAHRGVRDTARKIAQHVNGIFRFAKARGMRADNPADSLREVLPKPRAPKGRPALLTFPELGAVLRDAEKAHLSPAVRLALRLTAFTAARVGNVVAAEWKEFQLEAEPALWLIPRAKMKMRDRDHDHKVILAPQIAEALRAWRKLMGGRGYVFPGASAGKHICREAVEKALRVTLGLEGKHSPHGWRAALATLSRDGGFERDVVEMALDHVHDNEVVRAYDRGERLEKRIQLATWWGEQLTRAEHGADVLELKPKRA